MKSKSDMFYKLPKILFIDDKYKELSTDSKVLYALLLDRQGLSKKNNWIDKYGMYYQYFTVKETMKLLHFGNQKIIKLFKELEEVNLIKRRQQGLRKPNIIYVNKCWLIIFKSLEVLLSNTIYIDIRKTNNKTTTSRRKNICNKDIFIY